MQGRAIYLKYPSNRAESCYITSENTEKDEKLRLGGQETVKFSKCLLLSLTPWTFLARLLTDFLCVLGSLLTGHFSCSMSSLLATPPSLPIRDTRKTKPHSEQVICFPGQLQAGPSWGGGYLWFYQLWPVCSDSMHLCRFSEGGGWGLSRASHLKHGYYTKRSRTGAQVSDSTQIPTPLEDAIS